MSFFVLGPTTTGRLVEWETGHRKKPRKRTTTTAVEARTAATHRERSGHLEKLESGNDR